MKDLSKVTKGEGESAGQGGAEVKQVESITTHEGWLHVHLRIGKGVISTTGKSTVHASTGGFKPIEGTSYSINLVLIQKVKS